MSGYTLACYTVGSFQVNAYLIWNAARSAAVVVDTGQDGELAATLQRDHPDLPLRAILLTHAHFDHAGGLCELQAIWPQAETVLPALERPMFDVLPRQDVLFGFPGCSRPCGRIDREISDGEVLSYDGLEFTFVSTPGHTPGQGCYRIGQHIMVGDTLFAGSVGRTDFPMSDPQLAERSLARLMTLPGELVVCSGHGPDTTLARELRSNPFLRFVRSACDAQS